MTKRLKYVASPSCNTFSQGLVVRATVLGQCLYHSFKYFAYHLPLISHQILEYQHRMRPEISRLLVPTIRTHLVPESGVPALHATRYFPPSHRSTSHAYVRRFRAFSCSPSTTFQLPNSGVPAPHATRDLQPPHAHHLTPLRYPILKYQHRYARRSPEYSCPPSTPFSGTGLGITSTACAQRSPVFSCPLSSCFQVPDSGVPAPYAARDLPPSHADHLQPVRYQTLKYQHRICAWRSLAFTCPPSIPFLETDSGLPAP